jgi:hypothetical protein
MPDLPIGNEDGSFSAHDPLGVWACMAHPRREDFRHQFLARMYERVVAELQPELEKDVPAECPPDLVGASLGMVLGEWLQPLGGFQQLTRAPSASDAYERMFEGVWPGSIAGDMLIYMHQMKVSGIGPSVNKAIAVAVDYLTGATTPSGAAGRGASERYVRKQWVVYKPVAHLWAAFRAILFVTQEGAKLPGMMSDEGFPLFLAFSEWFAKDGLSIYPHGRRLPVLDSAELWRVPAAMMARIPPFKATWQPLPNWAVEVLSRYKARKSD